MSSSQVDKIISKYENKQIPYKFEIQSTKRKSSHHKDDHIYTFMNQSATPTKEINLQNTQRSERDIEETKLTLRQLDTVQRKLAASQKNYAEVCRKFEKLRLYSQSLQDQLQKERKSRLQELIDLQNKLILMQDENNKNVGIIQNKEGTIAVLQEKLKQKEQQIITFEQQLEQISFRLHHQIKMKDEEVENRQKLAKKQEQSLSISMLLKLKESHQKQIALLKEQLAKYSHLMVEKEKQKKRILDRMEELSDEHQKEMKELKESILVNEEKSRKWIDEMKIEKLAVIQKYESEIRLIKLKQTQLSNKQVDRKIEEQSVQKGLLREYEIKIEQYQRESIEKQKKIQNLTQQNKDDSARIQILEQKVDNLKHQYVSQLKESKKYLSTMEEYEEAYKKEKESSMKIVIEMEKIKDQVKSKEEEIKDLISQNESFKTKLKQLKRQFKSSNHVLEELNLNKNLTQTNIQQHSEIERLQEELETLTTDLYAERLENAKLKEEIESTKHELKRQYQLSLQNTKKELIEQIKNRRDGSLKQNIQDPQKERMYLQMFNLQRKYQMLKSQTITVQQMARMGDKLHKFYSKKKV